MSGFDRAIVDCDVFLDDGTPQLHSAVPRQSDGQEGIQTQTVIFGGSHQSNRFVAQGVKTHGDGSGAGAGSASDWSD